MSEGKTTAGADAALMQQFETGATRSADTTKPDFEGFLSPRVLIAFGDYMHAHRRQRDGSLRDSDNWQKGIPLANYMKSLVRHTFDLWLMHRGGSPINPDNGQPFTKHELMSAVMFNIMGYFHETLKAEEDETQQLERAKSADAAYRQKRAIQHEVYERGSNKAYEELVAAMREMS